jgi:hypothetical protein
MAFEDYTHPVRPWKVKSRSGNPRCTDEEPRCVITIGGTESDVTVRCSNDHGYDNGKYNQQDDTIGGKDYTLRRTPGPPNRLDCSDDREGPPDTTGSWTADDAGPFDPA